MAIPTIKDVARRAGVSPTAVSFVLNHKAEGRLTAATIERVRSAIRELDYRPDGVARRAGWRRAATPRTMGVGYLGADLHHNYHGAVIMAAAAEMQRAGYHLILASQLRTPEAALDHFRSLHGTAADGWLLTSIIEPPVIDYVVENAIPAVFVGSGTDVQGRLPQVRGDDFNGAYQATRHLTLLGHRRIGFVGIYPDAAFSRWRFEGYRAALHDAGLPIHEADVFLAEETEEIVRFAQERARGAPPTTAFVATGEPLALEIVRGLGHVGLSVPQDVSIVGFDDTGLARIADPPLTTIASPRTELGRLAARLLMETLRGPSRVQHAAQGLRNGSLPGSGAQSPAVEGRPCQAYPQTILPVELIVRGSTAPTVAQRAAPLGRRGQRR